MKWVQVLAVVCVVFTSLQAHAQPTGKELNILVGGGDRPFEATHTFVEASGGAKARLLIVSWASPGQPNHYAKTMGRDLKRHPLASLSYSITPPQTEFEADVFLKQLSESDGIFFSGGEQQRILEVANRFPMIRDEMRRRYHAGMPVMGTSAGTAMQAQLMIADDPLPGSQVPQMADGLGLLPEGLVVDTHYYARERWRRLKPLVRQNLQLNALGIDEDTAAMIRGQRWVEVVGKSRVMAISDKIDELNSGGYFDLKKWKKVSNPCNESLSVQNE